MSSDIQKVNELWTDIYYALRYDHKEKNDAPTDSRTASG